MRQEQQIAPFNIKDYQYSMIRGKYILGPNIGDGAYGNVFYAEDLNKNQYAIKIIQLKIKNQNIQAPDRVLQRLKQQDEHMMICKSQYLMKCYQSFNDESKNLKFIVMQLCKLGSLRDLIYFKGHLYEEEAKIIIKQLLCALSAIHKTGFLHRDIKSNNVCFSQFNCVLCDFGCAKKFLTQTEKSDWRATVKKQGTILGTILSKSPQMMSGQQYGFRTDIWAIGILFYQMITGIPPFFFKGNQQDKKAVQFIKKNIDSIYDEEYIKQNLKKYDLVGRGNFQISNDAKNFMKKLIVFDQNQRAGWKYLSCSQYLQKKCNKESWQIIQCTLPLKDIDWGSFIKNISDLCSQSTKINSNKQIKQISVSGKVSQVISKRMLNKEQKIYIRKKISTFYQNQIKTYNQIKKAHFQLRRMYMLSNLREHLSRLSLKGYKCQKVQFLIMKFCYLKLRNLQNQIKKSKIGFFQNLGIEPVKNLISEIYQTDKIQFKQNHSSIFNTFKMSLFYDKEKRAFYNSIQQEDFDATIKSLAEQSEKLRLQFQQKKQQKQMEFYMDFFHNSKQILQTQYDPTIIQNDASCWRQWQNFESIMSYLSDVEKIKKNKIK